MYIIMNPYLTIILTVFILFIEISRADDEMNQKEMEFQDHGNKKAGSTPPFWAVSQHGFPTIWTIWNHSLKHKIKISCFSLDSPKGAEMIMEQECNPNSYEQFTWSDWYYNDGLGLTSSEWKCTATIIIADNVVAQDISSAILMRTTWGEFVYLQVDDNSCIGNICGQFLLTQAQSSQEII